MFNKITYLLTDLYTTDLSSQTRWMFR